MALRTDNGQVLYIPNNGWIHKTVLQPGLFLGLKAYTVKEVYQFSAVFGEPSGTKVQPVMGTKISVIKQYLQTRATEDELREFASDILDGVSEQKTTGSAKRLDESLESWFATAEIGLDNEIIEEIRAGQDEIERGESITWKPGHFMR